MGQKDGEQLKRPPVLQGWMALSNVEHCACFVGGNPDMNGMDLELPSGKRLHNYGKSPCLMDTSTIHGNFQ